MSATVKKPSRIEVRGIQMTAWKTPASQTVETTSTPCATSAATTPSMPMMTSRAYTASVSSNAARTSTSSTSSYSSSEAHLLEADIENDTIEDVRRRLEAYWRNGTFCDLNIVCEGRELHAHVLILSAHSDWVEEWSLTSPATPTTRTLHMDGELYEVIERLVGFCYTCDYDDDITTDPVPDRDFVSRLFYEDENGNECVNTDEAVRPASRLELNALMYACADLHVMPNLAALALAKFRAAAEQLGRKGNAAQVLPRVTCTVYKDIMLGPENNILKEAVLDLWEEGGWDLSCEMEQQTKRALMRELPDFAYDLSQRLMARRFMIED